jgi:hypothetical protein
MKRALLLLCLILSLIPGLSRAEERAFIPNSQKYQSGEKIKILVIPGHDQKYSGAYWNGRSEQDLNLQLANQIRDELRKDPQLEVVVTRDERGYIPEIQNYFENNQTSIERFIESHKKATNDSVESGDISLTRQVPHHDAAPTVAYQLYAVNKWAADCRGTKGRGSLYGAGF